MTFLTPAVMGAVCLVFASTRKYAVLVIGLLLYLYPGWTLALLAGGGLPFLYFHLKPRSKSRGL